MVISAAGLEQAIRSVILDQLDLHPAASRLRILIDLTPNGCAGARSTPLPEKDEPLRVPTLEGERYRAWAEYDIGADRPQWLVHRKR